MSPLSPVARIAALCFVVLAAGMLAAGGTAHADETRPATAAASPSPTPSPVPSGAPSPPTTLQWRSIGPTASGGRIATIVGSPLDPALMYAGAAGGGVWKSTSGGLTWSPVFDAQTTQSIGAIAISPASADDVWVGTGEAWVRNDVLPGDGIYHSTDAGKTWTRTGLTGTSQIARILIDPRDPQRIVVAALGDPFRDSPERGVFRTTDGGKTWQKILYAGPSVGASDIAMDPTNPDVLYAGLWRFRRSSWNLTSGGDDDGLYTSSDGGDHWTRLRGNGLPSGTTGRIGLAIAPSRPQRIYALIESSQGLLWRSDDGGATWTKTSSNTLIDERPFYYTRIVVDPHDADHLFSVSVLLAESTNGGKTWHVSGKRLHGDHHDLWIAPNGRTIIDANDGGIGLSRDGGATWRRSNFIPLAQFYHVGLGSGDPYLICGGLQDNGSWCGPSRTGDPSGILREDWLRIGGGDGTWVVPAPDGHTIVASSGGADNGGEVTRYDTRTHTVVDVSPYLRNQNVVPPRTLRWRFNWETPLAFVPTQPGVVLTGGNAVFRSTDLGMHWTPISGDLTRNLRARQGLSGGPLTLDVTGAETFDTILTIAPSPIARNVMWVGTDDGVVQLTRDGGRHWRNVTPAGIDADARVPTIDASHHRAGTAYVAVDRHYVGDRTPYVYVTDDSGRHWRSITQGLPAAEIHVVREDPAAPDVLYAGTGKGVWWSADRGLHWQRFPAPLPAVEVRDLAVSANGDLVAATHGRGIEVFDDLVVVREHAQAVREGVRLFDLRTAYPLRRATPTVSGYPGSADQPPATIAFYQRDPAKTPLAIEIVDAHGRIVRRIAGSDPDDDGNPVAKVPNVAGTVRATWNLDRDPPTPWRRAPKWNQGLDDGQPVLHGTYTVRLIRDGKTYARTLRVDRDRAVASDADELAGDRFATPLYAELDALDRELNGLDNVRLALADRIATLHDAALVARAKTTLADTIALEHSVSSQPLNDQDNDFLEDLLRERVISFIGITQPGAPPQSQRDEATALERAGARAAIAYRAFLATEVRPLNAALVAAGAAPIDLDAVPAPQKFDPNADEHARRGDDDQ
jgi:photosystem II stability/assembly factor-like uncharacterized protein